MLINILAIRNSSRRGEDMKEKYLLLPYRGGGGLEERTKIATAKEFREQLRLIQTVTKCLFLFFVVVV